MSSKPPLRAPQPKQIIAQDCHHGQTREDEYAWLRDDNWQAVMKQPEQLQADIRAHLEAENAYTEQVLAPTKGLQQDLFAEMRARLQDDEASVPMNEGSLSWASRYAVGGEHPHICCGPRDAALDDMRVLINGDAEAESRDFFKLAGYEADRQGHLLAWSFDDKGSEYFTICLRDMQTGQDQKNRLLDTTGSMAWSACGGFLFYVGVDENHRPSRILRHAVGSPQAQDVCIYEEADAGFFIGLSSTRSGRFLIVSAHDHETSEAWLVPTDAPLSPPLCVATRRAGIEYDVDDDSARNRLVIVTNWDGAQKADDFQIVTADLPLTSPDTAMDDWHILRAHSAGCLILDAMPFADHLVILLRENAQYLSCKNL